MSHTKLLRAEHVAELLDEHLQTVRRMTRRGDLPAINIGTPNRPKWRYEPKAIDAWLAARRNNAA